jgi:hypothetical protein
MSFSRGRRPALEWERPKSAVSTTTTRPRSVPSAVPASAPPRPAPIAGALRTKGIQRERPGSAAPGTSPWGAPDLPDHPRPYTAAPRRRRPPSFGTDHSRGVTDEYRRLRFTLRNRAGPGVEGLERCLAAFAAYDPRRRGVIKRADFARALKNTLDVTLTERQSVAVAEDCRADAPASSAGFARIDYCHFLRMCFPSESQTLGVMSAEDRDASRARERVTRGYAERSTDSADAGLDTSKDDTFIREEDETTFDDASFENFDPRGESFAAAADDSLHGAIAGMRHLGVAHEATYPTRVGEAYRFRKQKTDVTRRTLQGAPTRVVPEERSREPPLNLFRGVGIARRARPLVDRNAPAHEGAMEALRTKLRERHAGKARSTGFGARALRATLLSSFPAREEKPTHFDFAQFRRAMASANVNARKEHHRALFEYYCDASGKLCVDAFCHQVVHGDSTAAFEGGAPARDPHAFSHEKKRDARFRNSEFDSDSSDSDSSPRAGRFGKHGSDITALASDGTPLRSLPPERAREKNAPLNVFAHEVSGAAFFGEDFSDVGSEKKLPGFASSEGQAFAASRLGRSILPESDEARGMRCLKRRLEQRLGAKDGDGYFVARRWLTRETGDVYGQLDRGEFLRAVEMIGLNAPDQGKEREALYEAHRNMTGMVDVASFCDAVVAFSSA